MKRILVLFGCLVCFPITPASADLLLNTSTLDSAEIDFDGAGLETSGSLGFASMSFVIDPLDFTGVSGFENITSMTVSFQTAPTSSFSAIVGGINPPGIGIFTPGESTAEEIGSLGGAAGESFFVSVTSTSTNGDQVFLSGLEMNSWRNFFPFSEVELTGATFDGGQTILTGNGGISGPDPILNFDSLTESFSLTGLGEPVRLANLRFSVGNAVPEPGAIGILGVGACLWVTRRRRVS